MPVIPAVKYSEIRSQLNTGDLLAFEGTDALDFMIKLLEEGSYSHVGMVLKDAHGELWFWDAPGGGKTFPDPYWTKPGQNKGCRVAKLDTLLAYYMTDMKLKSFTWRQLTPSIPYESGSALDQFLGDLDGTPFPGDNCELPPLLAVMLMGLLGANYEKDLPGVKLGLGLILTYLAGSLLRVPITGYTFCAQLVALTYISVGLLPPPGGPGDRALPANGYTPGMFMDQPVSLQLQNGAALSVAVPVEWDGGPEASRLAATESGGTRVHATALKLIVTREEA